MLFNATRGEELRIALVDNNQLTDLLLEQTNKQQKKANIYKGKITRIEPSLEAAFIDYGQERHGFLPIKEVALPQENEQGEYERPNIKDVLQEGQELLIQVGKEERGTKGAALSTFISLAGSYLVLMPNNPKAGGISRRIEGDERQQVKETLNQLEAPDDMGVIVRTAGVGKSIEELQWDLNYLLKLWETIQAATYENERQAPYLVYQESDVVLRALRDYIRPDIEEIIVDDPEIFEKVKQHIQLFYPNLSDKVLLYQDRTPLFTRYQLENQIKTIYQRELRLPSGGSIVIDRTEALVSIDINSAQSTKGEDIEETAFSTNLEAADEIARQLRLRDLGGLIVVDFIDMSTAKHQKEVEERLNQAVAQDRARIQLGRISRFGLLEMSRQRLRSAVSETTQELCPRCEGRGTIRSVESISFSILRAIEEAAAKSKGKSIFVQAPVEVGAYLLNEKRHDILDMEHHRQVPVFIVSNPHYEIPEYNLEVIKNDRSFKHSSYRHIKANPNQETEMTLPQREEQEAKPAVKNVLPETPAPQNKETKATTNPIKRWLSFIAKNFLKNKQEDNDDKPDTNRSQQNKQGSSGSTNQQQPRKHNPNQRHSHHKKGANRNNNRGNNNNKTSSQTDNQKTRNNSGGRNQNQRTNNTSNNNQSSTGSNRKNTHNSKRPNKNRQSQNNKSSQGPNKPHNTSNKETGNKETGSTTDNNRKQTNSKTSPPEKDYTSNKGQQKISKGPNEPSSTDSNNPKASSQPVSDNKNSTVNTNTQQAQPVKSSPTAKKQDDGMIMVETQHNNQSQ